MIKRPFRKNKSSVLVANNTMVRVHGTTAQFHGMTCSAIGMMRKGTTFLRNMPMAFPRGCTTKNDDSVLRRPERIMPLLERYILQHSSMVLQHSSMVLQHSSMVLQHSSMVLQCSV